jgi:hypothetical protein
MKKVDMSQEAIMARLQQVDKIRRLCLTYAKVKKRHERRLAELAVKSPIKKDPLNTKYENNY